MPDPCKHEEFDAAVRVIRLEDTGRFSAGIFIHCSECEQPFEFIGLPIGLDTEGAAMSLDGLEATLAIKPQGSTPPPLPPDTPTGYRIQIPGTKAHN